MLILRQKCLFCTGISCFFLLRTRKIFIRKALGVWRGVDSSNTSAAVLAYSSLAGMQLSLCLCCAEYAPRSRNSQFNRGKTELCNWSQALQSKGLFFQHHPLIAHPGKRHNSAQAQVKITRNLVHNNFAELFLANESEKSRSWALPCNYTRNAGRKLPELTQEWPGIWLVSILLLKSQWMGVTELFLKEVLKILCGPKCSQCMQERSG